MPAMKNIALALAASVTCICAASGSREMPIVAWGWTFKPSEATVSNYGLIQNSGCNHTIQWVKGKASVLKCLDAAAAAGIKLILHSPDVTAAGPGNVIPDIKNHPGLAAYYLVDEPPVTKMRKYGETARRIRKLDPAHPVYMNWFGIVDDKKRWYGVETFDEYLETSIKEVPTGLYTFDVYPLYAPRFQKRPFARSKGPLHLRKDWYASLEAVSMRSRRDKVPFWAFASIVPIRNHRKWDNPMPTRAHLRLQQYSNLAYGASGLQYYTFRPGAKTVENYCADGAPLSPEGKITPAYHILAEVNRELKARARVFLGCEPVRIRHAGTVPEGTVAFDAGKDMPPFLTGFVPDGELLISVMKDGPKGVLFVVNRDPNGVSAFTAKFAPGVKRVSVDGSLSPAPDGIYPMDIGDAEIFVFAAAE